MAERALEDQRLCSLHFQDAGEPRAMGAIPAPCGPDQLHRDWQVCVVFYTRLEWTAGRTCMQCRSNVVSSIFE